MENFCCDFENGNFFGDDFGHGLVMILSMEKFFGHVILVVEKKKISPVEHGKFCDDDFGCGNIFVGYVNFGMVNFCWLWVCVFVGVIFFFFFFVCYGMEFLTS